MNEKTSTHITKHIRVPKSRLGVVIGKKGEIKKRLETETQSYLEIDSEEGSVNISATPETEDPTLVWTAADVVKAIGRGFSEEKAFSLLNPDIFLEVMPLKGSRKELNRHKGRIIGEKGRSRRILEEYTGANIAVFGDTVSILGELNEIQVCKSAIEMILKGSRHSSVFKYLENLRYRHKGKPPRLWK